MFEWKPPDPRLVALVRRLVKAVRQRLRSRPASADTGRATGDDGLTDRESNDVIDDISSLHGDRTGR